MTTRFFQLPLAVVTVLWLVSAAGCMREGQPVGSAVPPDSARSSADAGLMSLSPGNILRQVTDAAPIDSIGMAVWRPPFAAGPKLPESIDGKCHTAVDTMLHFVSHEGDSCVVVILANYYFCRKDSNGLILDPCGAHFDPMPLGLALYRKEDSAGWRCYFLDLHFADLGHFGQLRSGAAPSHSSFGLTELGDHWTCLKLRRGIIGSTGIFWGYEAFYAIDEPPFTDPQHLANDGEWWVPQSALGRRLLIYPYHQASSVSNDLRKHVLTTASIHVDKRRGNYADIRISYKGYRSRTERYRFDDRYLAYILRE